MTTDVRKCTGGVLEPHVLGVQRAVDVPVDYPRVGAAGKAVSAAGGGNCACCKRGNDGASCKAHHVCRSTTLRD